MPSTSLIKEFEHLIGKENVLTSAVDRHAYAYDATLHTPTAPSLVLRPKRTEDIGPLVRRCYSAGLPIVPRGSGTNLSGGVIPEDGRTVVLLTNGMNRILEINTEDMYAVVEPGVVTAAMASAVAEKGLFYPPDPGSISVSTLAGNVAENAGGLRGFKYGVTKDYLLGLDFYDMDGELVKTGSRTVKCATGYNLAGLMTGSEGTLGIMSRLVFRLVPPPKASKAMLAVFTDTRAASEASTAIVGAHVVPATMEYLDNATLNRIEDYKNIGLPRDAAAILLIELDGHPAQVEDDSALVRSILENSGAKNITVAASAEERDKLWEARRAALPALARVKPTCVLEDATVPRSKVPDMITALDKIAAKFSLTMGVFGHAGDGNLHPTFLCDRRDQDEMDRVEKATDAIFEQALALGGTLSGEHGTGITKSRWLEKETSRGTLLFCRKLRKCLDPKGLLNASKITGV